MSIVIKISYANTNELLMLNFYVTKLSHYPHSYLLFVCLNNYLLFSTLLLLSQLYKNDDDDYVLCSLLLLMNFNAIVANNPTYKTLI